VGLSRRRLLAADGAGARWAVGERGALAAEAGDAAGCGGRGRRKATGVVRRAVEVAREEL
jgi:hypothetical protein